MSSVWKAPFDPGCFGMALFSMRGDGKGKWRGLRDGKMGDETDSQSHHDVGPLPSRGGA